MHTLTRIFFFAKKGFQITKLHYTSVFKVKKLSEVHTKISTFIVSNFFNIYSTYRNFLANFSNSHRKWVAKKRKRSQMASVCRNARKAPTEWIPVPVSALSQTPKCPGWAGAQPGPHAENTAGNRDVGKLVGGDTSNDNPLHWMIDKIYVLFVKMKVSILL